MNLFRRLFGAALVAYSCTLTLHAQTDVRHGLISYWPLEANDSGVATDLGYGNNMTINGSPSFVPGVTGNALSINATTDYLLNAHGTSSITNGLPVFNTNSGYTVAFWVKMPAPPANAGDKTIFGERGGANPIFFLGVRNISSDNGSRARLDVYLRNNSNVIMINHKKSTTTVFDNNWHHVAWVDNKGAVKLYIDGNLDGTDFSYTPSGAWSMDRTAIGALVQNNGSASQQFTNGVIDEVAVWERGLSLAEVDFVRTNGLASVLSSTSVPYISVLSTNVTNFVGGSLTFNPKAVGSAPFTYQWLKDGNNLGVTGNVLSMSNLSTNESGIYTITATNANGGASRDIKLTILPDPSFSVQPVGTNIYSKANWTFVSQASGTGPFNYQWYKNNAPISGEVNSSLALVNLQVADSGDYFVIATNGVGNSVTSVVATLTVTTRPAPPTSLALDFDFRGSPFTESGFQQFVLSGSGAQTTPTVRAYGGVEVSVGGSGGVQFDDRKRTTPTNTIDFTGEKIFQDFIFANDQTGTRGLDVTVSYLEPNQLYTVTIWSFDSGNSGARVSDWSINGNMVYDNYTFNGSIWPTANDQYRFSTNVMSDANGALLISGRRDPSSAGLAVFLNALKVSIPQPQISGISSTGANVQITFTTPNPNYPHAIQSVSDISSSAWTDVAGVNFTSAGPDSIQAQFSAPGGTRFYRVVRNTP